MLAAVAVLLLCFHDAISAPVQQDDIGLYGPEDNVTIVTGENFKDTIFNRPNIWMVEFYSSWCGHCQTFAPTFKAFGKNVAEWQEVYRVAVINCPDEVNRHICRDMNVTGYPTMRIFPPFSSPEEPGIKINERTVEKLRNASVEYIEKYLDDVKWDLPGVPKPSFDFITYEDILEFQIDPDAPYYLAVIIEKQSSDIGKEVILDMSSCRNISTRIFNASSDELEKVEVYSRIKVKELPTVIVFTKDRPPYEIEVKFRQRSFYSYKLRNLPGVGDPKPLPKQEIGPGSKSKGGIVDWTQVDRGKVYMADIESGLRYALTVEVGSMRVLEGETLDAIKNFVGTLALLSEQFPISRPTKNFIVRLTGWLASQQSIDHDTWQKRMEEYEPNSHLPKLDQKWVGCAPSKPGLRGYPCSLWTLFHALTVAGYNKKETDVQAVPRAMELYITNFFTCMECRKNFVGELLDSPFEETVQTQKDAVMWLWALHNKVNKRLHGAVSEDPNIPKVQFPPLELCPECHNSLGSWNKQNVVNYLIERYSDDAVSREYTVTQTLKEKHQEKEYDVVSPRFGKMGNDFDQDFGVDLELHAKLEDNDFDDMPKQAPSDNGNIHLARELIKERTKERPIHIIQEGNRKKLEERISYRGQEWHNTSGLTFFDTSLCFILWAGCPLLLLF